MFVHVNKVDVIPERSRMFLHLSKSSGEYSNNTYIFYVNENAYFEKTGNISIFVSIAAFNTNYTLYQTFSQSRRKSSYRWRTKTDSFNLTVLPKTNEVYTEVQILRSDYKFLYKFSKRVKISRTG